MSGSRPELPARIETERLFLRPFRFGDVDDVFSYASEEGWARYLPLPQPYLCEHAEEFVARQILKTRSVRPGWAVVFEDHVVGGVRALGYTHRAREGRCGGVVNDRSEDFEAIVASVEAGEVAGERGPQRAPWIKRPLVWVPILIVVAFVAGLLVPWPGEVEGPRPVGTMEAMDPEGDVTTHYDNVEPVPAEVRSWLDIRSVSIDSNGDEMSIRLVTAERDAGSEASAVRRGSRSFHISLLHDDRTIYSLTVSPDKDPGRRVHMVDMQLNRDIQASREVYRDAVCPDAEPIDPCGDPDLSPLRRTVPTGAATADVAGNTLTVRLDLGRLPKLLYGVSWHVTARGMLATGSLSIPHEDRVPDEGSLAFPPPKDEEDAPARDPSAG